MPGAQQGPSFIPKRTPTKHKRKGPRRLYLFSYIAYILIFGAVLTAAGVFVYKLQVEAQMVERQKTLSEAVNDFNQSDLEMVKEFEKRLHFANQRMQHHYAPSRILTFFEEVTAAPVQLTELIIVRAEDEAFEVSGSVVTDTFNSTIFQRDVLRSEAITTAAFVEGVKLAELQEQDGRSDIRPTVITDTGEEAETVDFALMMQLDPAFLPYEGLFQPVSNAPPTPSAGTSTPVLPDNQTGV